MMDATTLMKGVRLVPVVVIEDAAHALPLAETLYGAGLRAIEFTLRTEAALAAIELTAKAVPDMLTGAGSVRNLEQLGQVRDAGAHFAVSPGHTDTLLDACEEFPYIPGAATAAECMHLLERGYRLQKFFPAELSGGVGKIRAISAPLPEVRFCTTGGIDPDNMGRYLECPAVACVGGSWFIPALALEGGDFATIGELSRATMQLVARYPAE